jgi:hypothetical protein
VVRGKVAGRSGAGCHELVHRRRTILTSISHLALRSRSLPTDTPYRTMADATVDSPPPAEASIAVPGADEAPAAASGDAAEDPEEALRKRLLAEAEGLGSDNEVYEFSEGETVRLGDVHVAAALPSRRVLKEDADAITVACVARASPIRTPRTTKAANQRGLALPTSTFVYDCYLSAFDRRLTRIDHCLTSGTRPTRSARAPTTMMTTATTTSTRTRRTSLARTPANTTTALVRRRTRSSTGPRSVICRSVRVSCVVTRDVRLRFLPADPTRTPLVTQPSEDAAATAQDEEDTEGSGVDPGEEEDGRPAKRVKVAA